MESTQLCRTPEGSRNKFTENRGSGIKGKRGKVIL